MVFIPRWPLFWFPCAFQEEAVLTLLPTWVRRGGQLKLKGCNDAHYYGKITTIMLQIVELFI